MAEQFFPRPTPKPEVVSDRMIESLIWVESRNNPDAVGTSGELGPAQIMPHVAVDPGFGVDPVANSRDPIQARVFVRQYLTAMIKRYHGDLEASLMAYNWGPRNVDKWIRKGRIGPVPKVTRDYTKRVRAALEIRMGAGG